MKLIWSPCLQQPNQSQWQRRLQKIMGLLLCLFLLFGHSSAVLAAIHRYPEGTNQVMYRSKQSLRDRSGLSWQVVLFKRLKFGQLDTLHLRLVGFPGLVEVAHHKPLDLVGGTGQTWSAKDVTDLSLPNNVAEYDVFEVMTQLEKNTPLQLFLPLKGDQISELLIPPFVVREWQTVLSRDELSDQFSGNL